MDLGSVTLLELLRVPDGGRLGYCLPSGEFVLASSACAAALGAHSAAALYGQNFFALIEPADAERLEDYERARYRQGGGFPVDPEDEGEDEPRLMVRLARGGRRPATLWARLATLPLTLRLLRCVDALLGLGPPRASAFADSSSLVATEDELAALLSQGGARCRRADAALAEDLAGLVDCARAAPLERRDDGEASLASYAFAADWADELDARQAPALVL